MKHHCQKPRPARVVCAVPPPPRHPNETLDVPDHIDRQTLTVPTPMFDLAAAHEVVYTAVRRRLA